MWSRVLKVKEQCEFRLPFEDKIRVMICSSALKSPISTRLTPSAQMTSNKVLGEITKVLQSNEEIPLDQFFVIDIIDIKSTYRFRKISQGIKLCKGHSPEKIYNYYKSRDNLCCGRALAVRKALADNHTVTTIKNG